MDNLEAMLSSLITVVVVCAGLAPGVEAFAPPVVASVPGLRSFGLHAQGGRWGRGSSRAAVARRGALPLAAAATMEITNKNKQTLITKPRTSHAWFGVYFDIEALAKGVTIESIETGCSSGAEGQTLKVQVWTTKEGSFVGKEEDRSAWECLGEEEMVLNTVNYDKRAYDASSASYGKLPFKSKIHVDAGKKRGFMIHTSSLGGLILRGGFGPEAQKNNWKVGEKSDETVHVKLLAGPVTSSAPFTLEKDSPGSLTTADTLELLLKLLKILPSSPLTEEFLEPRG